MNPTCDFFSFKSQTLTCKDGNQQVKENGSDSPLQIKLINFLGLRSFVIGNFIFKRKNSKYQICKVDGKQRFLTPYPYTPPQGYTMTVKIIEKPNHSVPILILTPTNHKPRHTIVYSHGNASDLADSLWFVEKISRLIYAEFVVYDYSGYGCSRVKEVGQQIICGDLQMVLAWLGKPMSQVILWGFSLGTFPVIYNAAKYKVKGIILQSPIASVSCIFQKEINKNTEFKQDYLANLKHFDKIKGKIFMAHSSADEIIPFSHSKLLYDKFVAKNGDQNITFIEIAKIKHNQMNYYISSEKNNSLKRQVLDFLGTLFFQSCEQNSLILDELRIKLTEAPLEPYEFNEDNFQITTAEGQNQRTGNIVGDFKGCLCMKK